MLKDSIFYYDFKDFLYLADLLNIKISEIADRKNYFEKLIHKLYNSKLSLKIQKIVRHW